MEICPYVIKSEQVKAHNSAENHWNGKNKLGTNKSDQVSIKCYGEVQTNCVTYRQTDGKYKNNMSPIPLLVGRHNYYDCIQ